MQQAISCSVGFHRPRVSSLRIGHELCVADCKGCGQLMRFARGQWKAAEGTGGNRRHVKRRCFAATMGVLLALGPPQAFASKSREKDRSSAPSLAELETQNQILQGFHCQSPIDGTVPSAVEQIQSALGERKLIRILETYLTPSRHGRHELAMAYIIEVAPGIEELRETRGSVESFTCRARLS